MIKEGRVEVHKTKSLNSKKACNKIDENGEPIFVEEKKKKKKKTQ